MERKIYIDFILWNTKIPPKEITKAIDIIPDIELLRGERNKERNLPRQNIWSLESTIDSLYIKDHWKELEYKLNPIKNKLKDITKDCTVKMVIVINAQGYVPDITIPFEMLKFTGYINGVIDVDQMQ